MAEKDFQVSLPPEVVGAFGWNDAEVPRRVREALVMDLLRLDRFRRRRPQRSLTSRAGSFSS